jgi:hypothetical protein
MERKIMSLKQHSRRAIVAVGLCLATAAIALPAAAKATERSYPWCTQGDTLHCYYMNRAQCEETVDYHGFCVVNPDYGQTNKM